VEVTTFSCNKNLTIATLRHVHSVHNGPENGI
jgi:hypothetical protein